MQYVSRSFMNMENLFRSTFGKKFLLDFKKAIDNDNKMHKNTYILEDYVNINIISVIIKYLPFHEISKQHIKFWKILPKDAFQNITCWSNRLPLHDEAILSEVEKAKLYDAYLLYIYPALSQAVIDNNIKSFKFLVNYYGIKRYIFESDYFILFQVAYILGYKKMVMMMTDKYRIKVKDIILRSWGMEYPETTYHFKFSHDSTICTNLNINGRCYCKLIFTRHSCDEDGYQEHKLFICIKHLMKFYENDYDNYRKFVIKMVNCWWKGWNNNLDVIKRIDKMDIN